MARGGSRGDEMLKTLSSPQWRIFYLTLLVGLLTGGLVAAGSAAMATDLRSLGPLFWVELVAASIVVVGLPHYILFKIAQRKQLNRVLQLFYTAVERPAPKLDSPFKSREMDDLDALFDQMLAELRQYIANAVTRQVALERLSRYFSPVIAEHLAREGETGDAPKKMNVTVLFVDIRGFTPMSSRLDPNEVVEFLNQYFTEMIDIVYRERGTVLKLIGDSVMAVFGAPMMSTDDTARAIRVGAIMQQQYRKVEADWLSSGRQPPMGIGVGMNRGEVIVGNIGSPHHLDYTVIGDTVNVASRLCSIAKPGQVLVSASCIDGLGAVEGVRVIPAGSVTVKGKDEPIEVYEAQVDASVMA